MLRRSILLLVVVPLLLAAGCGSGLSAEEEAAEHRIAGSEANSRGAWSLAIEEYTQAIDLDAVAGDYVGRAFALGNRRAVEDAVADLTEAIALDGDAAVAFGRRALIYSDLGRWEEAVADFDRAIELLPDRPDQYAGRALAHLNLQQFDQALSDATTAIDLDPLGRLAPAFLVTRGNIYLQSRRYDEALADFDASLQLRVESGRTQLLRATALTALGRLDEARTTLEGALELVLDPIERLQIESALEALGDRSSRDAIGIGRS